MSHPKAPSSPQTKTNSSNNPSSFKIFLVVITLILFGALIGIIAAHYLPYSSSSPAPVPKPTSSLPAPIPTPTIIDSSWKTFTTPALTFQYPDSLTPEERQNNFLVLLSDVQNPSSVLLSVDARLIGNYSNYQNALTETKANLTNTVIEEENNIIKISGKTGSGYGQDQLVYLALIPYQKGAIVISTTATTSAQLQIFDQILSTLKLTTITPSAGYSCPANGWVDCLPGTTSKPECSAQAMAWYKANCANFQGAAL